VFARPSYKNGYGRNDELLLAMREDMKAFTEAMREISKLKQEILARM
jgi:vacuolar-type H+-ATPase subunit B/Vma2